MPSRLDLVVSLLHTLPFGTLATHSTSLPGYPFVTALPFVCDERHRPVFLISQLAEHTRNLQTDPRASLLLLGPGEDGVEAAPRATLVGKVVPLDPAAAPVDRYLRYFPQAADYLQLDFRFFRMIPERVRAIAGIGQAGWIEGDALVGAPSLTPQQEQACLDHAQAQLPAELRLLGVDPYGVDYARDGLRRRKPFERGAVAADALPASVDRLLRNGLD